MLCSADHCPGLSANDSIHDRTFGIFGSHCCCGGIQSASLSACIFSWIERDKTRAWAYPPWLWEILRTLRSVLIEWYDCSVIFLDLRLLLIAKRIIHTRRRVLVTSNLRKYCCDCDWNEFMRVWDVVLEMHSTCCLLLTCRTCLHAVFVVLNVYKVLFQYTSFDIFVFRYFVRQ